MKILVLLACAAFVSSAPAPEAEEHKVEKRSPDDDVYLFYPSSSFRGIFGSSPRSRFSGFNGIRRPFGGYFLELDDRRKRQVAPADAKRQKRAADFDDDDRVFFYSSPRAVTSYSSYRSVVPTTRFTTTVQRPVGRFFIDYDDLFDDRRKRQIKPEDAKRQKRDADFDDDDDERVHYFSSPVVTYSAPAVAAPAISAPVATRFAAVAPTQTFYYVDDDDDHDRKKRSANPDDDDDDDFRVVYTAATAPVATTYSVAPAPVVFTQPRTAVQTVFNRPIRYYYDFDDKK